MTDKASNCEPHPHSTHSLEQAGPFCQRSCVDLPLCGRLREKRREEELGEAIHGPLLGAERPVQTQAYAL